MDFREESDSLGVVKIPKDKMWGAGTERALKNFSIGGAGERMPLEVIYALALIKKSSARAHRKLGLLDKKKALAIEEAAGQIAKGRWDSQFPLTVWQTGSGTGSNMNVNEVTANVAAKILKLPLGNKSVHPNDDVNKGQSSNDVFPSAMHISSALGLKNRLLKSLKILKTGLEKKAKAFSKILKSGRTHLMDAVPLTLGQEFSGYVDQLCSAEKRLEQSLLRLYPLALGGTAVGTGLNASPDFPKLAVSFIAEETGLPFTKTGNHFSASSAHDDLASLSAELKTLAGALMKIGNDIRLMASGPRNGFNEIFIPAGEPGSSIMPGKVNPTQCEALTQVCAEVMGCDSAVAVGASQGHFELNVFKPLIIFNILRSLRLLSEAMESFYKNCIEGLRPNEEQLKKNIERSLMLVTALNPHIGYDKSALIAKKAYKEGKTLKEAAEELGYVSAEDFEKWVNPRRMAQGGQS